MEKVFFCLEQEGKHHAEYDLDSKVGRSESWPSVKSSKSDGADLKIHLRLPGMRT